MSLTESVDSLPTFKKALHSLSGKYKDVSNLPAIIEEVVAFSQSLNRHASPETLQQAASSLELLLEALKSLHEGGANYQTSSFSIENFADDSLSAHFDDLFTKLSASLPNVFNADDEERAKAVDSTIKHLEEIGRFAEIHGNSHVVGLSDAMVSVVRFHKQTLVESGSESDNGFLVKPLLRGFALLRTAFDSPDEPNLSPALIDSTANLRDLIGEHIDDPTGFDFENSSAMFKDLSDETVVESSQTTIKPMAMRRAETKKTVAFQSISALVPPSDDKQTDREELPELFDSAKDSAKGPLRPSQLGGPPKPPAVPPTSAAPTSGKAASVSIPTTASKVASSETHKASPFPPPRQLDTLLYGFTKGSKRLDRFTHVIPMDATVVETLEEALSQLKSRSFDLVISNGELPDEKVTPLYELIDKMDEEYQMPIMVVTSVDDFNMDLLFPKHPAEFSKYMLRNIFVDEDDDDIPDLFD